MNLVNLAMAQEHCQVVAGSGLTGEDRIDGEADRGSGRCRCQRTGRSDHCGLRPGRERIEQRIMKPEAEAETPSYRQSSA